MAEYIEREAALDVVNGWREQLIPMYGENDEYVKCLETVAEHLYFIPAADVQHVLTCSSCRYYHVPTSKCLHINGLAERVFPSDYCSYGAKMEVQDDD